MCLGVPMQVEAIAPGGGIAACRTANGAGTRDVATLLLDGPAQTGDWLLVHIDTAIRSISEEEAATLADALAAVAAAQEGRPFDHLFADLIEREPQLPDHLRPQHNDREALS